MDGLVRQVRIEADVAGRVREPVAVVGSRELGDDRLYDPVDHVMAVPAERGAEGSEHAAEPGRHRFKKAVEEELVDQGKRQHRREGRDRRAHEGVALARGDSREPHEKCRDKLAAVVVVDRLSAVPGVRKGHVGRAQGRRDEAVIHELLGAVGRRLVADHPDPGKEEHRERSLFDHDKAHIGGFGQGIRLKEPGRRKIYEDQSDPDDEAVCLGKADDAGGV